MVQNVSPYDLGTYIQVNQSTFVCDFDKFPSNVFLGVVYDCLIMRFALGHFLFSLWLNGTDSSYAFMTKNR